MSSAIGGRNEKSFDLGLWSLWETWESVLCCNTMPSPLENLQQYASMVCEVLLCINKTARFSIRMYGSRIVRRHVEFTILTSNILITRLNPIFHLVSVNEASFVNLARMVEIKNSTYQAHYCGAETNYTSPR